mgnify:CR=1 FL=1
MGKTDPLAPVAGLHWQGLSHYGPLPQRAAGARGGRLATGTATVEGLDEMQSQKAGAREIAKKSRGRMAPTDISNPKYFHKVVDCQWACPTHTPVPEYIRLIAQGRYAAA